jgi:anti-sigma factor RsiW
MYTCKDSIELLRDYLDGELPPEEAKHLEEHLSECPPCVDFLQTYRATPKVCKWALARKMPAELGNRLTEFLRAKLTPIKK